MRKGVAVLFGAALMVAVTAGPAAAVTKVKTSFGGVSSNGGTPIVWVAGDLESPKAKCLVGRTVNVYSGPTRDGAHTFYGSDTTDVVGYFEVTGSTPDHYHFGFVVPKVRYGKTICKGTSTGGFFE